jgi:hypothetical protein
MPTAARRHTTSQLAIAMAVLSGCAPLADFRPPSALVRGGRNFEVGGGGVYVTPRPYVVESGHANGQLWFTGKAASWLSLSLAGAFDSRSALGGAAALARIVTTDRFVGGTGVELGFAWAGASVSGAFRLFDDAWIYTAPRLSNWGKFLDFGVPVGLSLPIVDGFVLRAEGQASWEKLAYYNRRIHVGGALAYEW